MFLFIESKVENWHLRSVTLFMDKKVSMIPIAQKSPSVKIGATFTIFFEEPHSPLAKNVIRKGLLLKSTMAGRGESRKYPWKASSLPGQVSFDQTHQCHFHLISLGQHSSGCSLGALCTRKSMRTVKDKSRSHSADTAPDIPTSGTKVYPCSRHHRLLWNGTSIPIID